MTTSHNTLQDIVCMMTHYCEQHRWLWVAGLAREAWPVLVFALDQLPDVAQMAVLHYVDEAETEGGNV